VDVVIHLIGTFETYIATLEEIRQRAGRGQQVHGLNLQQAMEMVEVASRRTRERLERLMEEVVRTPPQ
jgi:hypothetical protein